MKWTNHWMNTCFWSLQFFTLIRENIDLNRVPQVIHEASCHTSHSCRTLDSAFGLETIPVSLRMPVLKKNPSCFPKASYSLEFELITIACICAISRHSWTGLTALWLLCDCSVLRQWYSSLSSDSDIHHCPQKVIFITVLRQWWISGIWVCSDRVWGKDGSILEIVNVIHCNDFLL